MSGRGIAEGYVGTQNADVREQISDPSPAHRDGRSKRPASTSRMTGKHSSRRARRFWTVSEAADWKVKGACGPLVSCRVRFKLVS